MQASAQPIKSDEYLKNYYEQDKTRDVLIQFFGKETPTSQRLSYIEEKDKPYFWQRVRTDETHIEQGCDQIILDLDEDDKDAQAEKIRTYCNARGIIFEEYRSGGKRNGYHFHIYCKELGYLEKEEREYIRLFFIEMFNADRMLKTDRHLIALPGTIRHVTGRRKE